MKQLKVMSAVGLLALAGAAQADVSSTITIVSDYDFRGITQTAEKPALQVSLDYAHESGWYAGIWGSNVDDFYDGTGLNTASTELDYYTGFKFAFGDDTSLDAGIVYYTYAGASDLDFAEIYGKFTWTMVTLSAYYSNDFGGKASGGSSDDAFYVSGDVAIPAGPVSVGVHAGYSDGDGISAAYATTEKSYIDYSVGVSYSGSNFTTGIKWVGYDADSAGHDDRIILSVSTSLPWAQ